MCSGPQHSLSPPPPGHPWPESWVEQGVGLWTSAHLWTWLKELHPFPPDTWVRNETLAWITVKTDTINQPKPSNAPSQGRVERELTRPPICLLQCLICQVKMIGNLWELHTEKIKAVILVCWQEWQVKKWLWPHKTWASIFARYQNAIFCLALIANHPTREKNSYRFLLELGFFYIHETYTGAVGVSFCVDA